MERSWENLKQNSFESSNWSANLLAGSHFRAQESRALSLDNVCAMNAGPAGYEATSASVAADVL